MTDNLRQLFRTRASRFDALLRPYLDDMYRLALRLSGNEHDAEDLVQDLAIRLYSRLDEMEKVECLRPWLARVLHNLYIDAIRSRQRRPHGYIDHDSDRHLAGLRDQADAPDEIFELDDLQRELAASIACLSEEHRYVVIMHDMEGYTLNELTGILDVPLGTLKSRLHRARRQLRDTINRELSEHIQRANG
jgi:RNA polymerase sigma-70 factor (ECF subfamily)